MSESTNRKSGLTANTVKHAKPKKKAYKLSNRDGLYLLVKPSGTRYWRLNYHFRGQQRTLSFDRWPEILLGEAWELLLEARRQLARGFDPLEQAKLDKIAKSIDAAHTFKAVAEEWLEKIEASKRYDTANRMRSTRSQVFLFAIATARAERDICADLRGALVSPRTAHRAAITTPTEAGGHLRALADYDGNDLARVALRLLPHLDL